MRNENVLLVDFEENFSKDLQKKFEEEGFFVTTAKKNQLSTKINSKRPEIVVANGVFLDEESLHFFLDFKNNLNIYLIFVVDKSFLENVAMVSKFFDADDFAIFPATPEEIVFRVKKILNLRFVDNDVIEKKHLKIDLKNYELFIAGEKKKAAPKEIELLYKLVSNENLLFTREQLLDEVWGYHYVGFTRTVDVHIKRVRAKLKAVSNEYFIKTVWGVGYIFKTLK